MPREWVDFNEIKAAVDIQMVLEHYGVQGLIKSGYELRGSCPIHKGSARSKNFTVNLQKNAFKCFSSKCNAKGNVLDLVAAMEGCDVRNAALKLAEWFKVGESHLRSPKQGKDIDQRSEIQRGIYKDKDGALYEVLAEATSGEDFEPLVVYRELFGDYRFWVAPPVNFGTSTREAYSLVKPFGK